MTVIAHQQPSFIATVAHELRGPLTAIETASELLDRDFDLLETDQVRQMVSGIHRRTLWMRGLLENLLTSAAVREGRFRVHPRPLDVVDIIREVETIIGPLLARRGQSVIVRPLARCPLVEADDHRISQVLLNLLSNANKYADAGTEIEIGVSLNQGAVRVSVSDRGPGLPRDTLGTAFRAYDRAGRTGGEGLGIGLWVVRSIVRAHGGRVGAFNREGGGATFWFELRPMVGRPATQPVDETELSAEAGRMSAV
jgi:signal transduction histidine kinase